jgi:hypothetical protein
MKQAAIVTISQIVGWFGLDSQADAWQLVLEREWEHERNEAGVWMVTVPPDEWEPRW